MRQFPYIKPFMHVAYVSQISCKDRSRADSDDPDESGDNPEGGESEIEDAAEWETSSAGSALSGRASTDALRSSSHSLASLEHTASKRKKPKDKSHENAADRAFRFSHGLSREEAAFLKQRFRQFDMDGNGFIDTHE